MSWRPPGAPPTLCHCQRPTAPHPHPTPPLCHERYPPVRLSIRDCCCWLRPSCISYIHLLAHSGKGKIGEAGPAAGRKGGAQPTEGGPARHWNEWQFNTLHRTEHHRQTSRHIEHLLFLTRLRQWRLALWRHCRHRRKRRGQPRLLQRDPHLRSGGAAWAASTTRTASCTRPAGVRGRPHQPAQALQQLLRCGALGGVLGHAQQHQVAQSLQRKSGQQQVE